jgi:uncharacterized membrane protein HdeD (DUF308 family)
MSSSAAAPDLGHSDMPVEGAREVAREAARFWWIWLVAGALWCVASIVILQFDSASITTIGVIVGVMFIVSGFQQFTLGVLGVMPAWLTAIFGTLFLIAGVICFINPEATFVGLADVLGFLFMMVGVWWTIKAFMERGDNPLWVLGLISGLIMIVLAFWTGGQFFIEKAYTLLVFAGIWAMLHGITDIGRAFVLRASRDAL